MKYRMVAPGLRAPHGTPPQCCQKALRQVRRFRQGRVITPGSMRKVAVTTKSISARSGVC